MTLLNNIEGLSNWFDELNNVYENEDKIININVYGDSISLGVGAAQYNNINGKWRFGYVGRIRERFKNIFNDVGRGVLPSYSASYEAWGPLIYEGTWSYWTAGTKNVYKGESIPNYGFMGAYKYTDEENAKISSTFNGTGIDIFIEQDENGGTATTFIDGEEVGTINCYNSTTRPFKISHNDLSEGNHLLEIIKSGDNKPIYFLGFQEIVRDFGVNVNSMSLGSSEMSHIESQNIELMSNAEFWNAKLTIINLVTNSLTESINSFLTNLDTIITDAQKTGNVLIVLQNLPPENYITSFITPIISYADDNNVALIDLYNENCGIPTYLVDGVHPNIVGHKWEADQILSMILPDSMRFDGLELKVNNRLLKRILRI